MPHRIVFNLDDPPHRCGFLRETAGDFTPLENDPFVVIAREYDESGACLRSWFLGLIAPTSDGVALPTNGTPPPPHKIVSPNIVPGEESKPADPMARIAGGLEPILHTLKQQQIRDVIKVRQHQEFCATYRAALERAEQLQVELSAADARNREFAERCANLESELQRERAALESLRTEKSWRQQIEGLYRKLVRQ
jgi:hypothetical protein